MHMNFLRNLGILLIYLGQIKFHQNRVHQLAIQLEWFLYTLANFVHLNISKQFICKKNQKKTNYFIAFIAFAHIPYSMKLDIASEQ